MSESLLEKIHGPEDLRRLSFQELEELCGEIRTYLIEQVSRTGGHLASNLGVVELTVALHKVFQCPQDAFVWDVGHQSYVHKLLTGRREAFPTLRQKGGLSGFTSPTESPYDAFGAGHSSTSISAALGLAYAEKLRGGNHFSIAIIGDGAMTGGMAFEALNNAGRSGTRLLIILNDNDHSINANVGAVADLFGKVRVSSAYYQAKLWTKKRVSAIPYIGKALYTGFHNTKSALKRWLYRKSIFQQMGLEYLGPIDGHDLKELYDALMAAKAIEKPCILHIKTVKGKGYPFAEQEPTRFHGTSGFDIATGRDTAPKKPGFSGELGKLLCKKAGENAKLCAITAAMASGTGLESFERRYPDRFYDVGIAEQHAVTFAAGLAKGGLIPVIAIYSTFLQRAYDQVLHDVALQGLHVIFAIDRAGFVGADGATHQGLFDLSYLRQMPGMTIYSPATFSELAQCLEEALTVDGPCAIRYPKGGEADLHTFLPHGDYLLSHRPGAETLLLTYGREAEICQEAARLALEQGVSVDVVKLLKLQPLDCKALQQLFEGYRAVWIVEESEAAGSLGEFLAAGIPWNTPPHLRAVHGFVPHATEGEQREFCGLDAASICREILEEQGH